MKRELVCIICPRGCRLTVEGEVGNLTVTGNACPKGKQYAIDNGLTSEKYENNAKMY